MAKINIEKAPVIKGSTYPSPFEQPAKERTRHRLGDAGGLTDFGVNLTRMPPGCWSSQRHWHSKEDEFVYVLEGELTLITDAGEEILRAGDCVAFPKNTPNGHHLINKSKQVAVFLEVGTRREDDYCTYPDIDMVFDPKDDWYSHRDGKLYPKR